jgi:hypothetical protein
VTWHTLARSWRRDPRPRAGGARVWTDSGDLAAWTVRNLDDYWRRLLQRTSDPKSLWSVAAATSYGAVWIVLGVSRLHFTLSTGDICSKEGAGCYALEAFPERWHRVINESLRIRRADRALPHTANALTGLRDFAPMGASGMRRSLYRTPLARRHDVRAFGDMAVADAHRLHRGTSR